MAGTAKKAAAAVVTKTSPEGAAAGAAAKVAAKKTAAKKTAAAAPTKKAPAGSAPAKKTAAAPAKRGPDFTAARNDSARRLRRMPNGRRWLLAEWLLCVLLLGISGMTGKPGGKDDPSQTGAHLAVKGSALAGVFILLALLSAGGKGAERAAGAIGAVVTLAYVFNERSTFETVAKWARASGGG